MLRFVLPLLCAGTAAIAAPGQVLTLEQAVRSARERQPQIRAARASADAARARADAARSALFPQITATAGYQRTTANAIERPGTLTTTRSGSFDTFNFFSSGLALNQLVWDFGQASGRHHAAQAQASVAEGNERATALSVVLQVSAAFFDARASKSLLAVARDSLENQKRHLDQIESFVKSGVRPDIDLFQARTDTANAEVALINAENGYAVARASLNQAMGVEGPVDYDVADEAPPPVSGEDGSAEQLLVEALKGRPDVAALEEAVRAQQLTVRAIEGAYWPSISASAGLTQGGTALDNLGWNASAGLSLAWPLYQGGLTKAQVREAEANVASARAQLESLRLSIRTELDQARLAVRAAKAALRASGDAVQNARERLKLAEGRYEQGVGNIIELGDAQVALTQAAAQAVQADYRLAAARAQLAKALGKG